MTLTEALEFLADFERKNNAYSHAIGLLTCDGQTAAPKNSYIGRSATIGVLGGVQYQLLVNDQLRIALDTIAANKELCDQLTLRRAELIRDAYNEMTVIPADEYSAYLSLLSESDAVWHDAKEKSDFAMFAPYLAKIVAYNRQQAERKKPGQPVYDTLLDTYEKGLTTAQLDPFFKLLRDELSPIIKKISAMPQPRTDFLHRFYPAEQQRKFAEKLMDVICIDKNDCSLGETEHPFTNGFNKHDVRITTHYYENNVDFSMFSVIHEGGHALYEMGVSDELAGTAAGTNFSMSIHESQSRFYENLIGRSEGFCKHIFPLAQECFPEQLADVTADEFWRGINVAEPSLIRTEADELTYSLHIMIRYELEKKMLNNEIAIEDLPAEWNRMYKEYLGIDVPDDKHGVLQDTHWSGGMLGYFPSYALGSAYGVQMLNAMKKDLDFDACVASGNIAPIGEWLDEKVHRLGNLLNPGEILRNACGCGFDPHCYVEYLKDKYTRFYSL